MGKATGFLETARMENPLRAEDDRLRDFSDLHASLPVQERHSQASRCMDCGVPFCQSDFGCPLHNLIPEWNDLLWQGQEKEALSRLLLTAPFPEFTGHVCPALCEKACNLADEGVTNRDNELYLIETGFARGWVVPRVPSRRTGKQVAVVGSGPAGLAAADLLNQRGHTVTVIERADRPGGLMMYGIPNMKLPKEIVERRIRLMEAEGISFLLNTEADPDQLRAFDAVILCCGSRRPRSLNLPHMDAEGVHYAVDYLTCATRDLLSGSAPVLSASGRHCIVVGGGDTGNDCVATALRQGASSVTQLEMMPKPCTARVPGNPWPEWPRTLRTDYGQLEAVSVQGSDPRVYETTVSGIQVDERSRSFPVIFCSSPPVLSGVRNRPCARSPWRRMRGGVCFPPTVPMHSAAHGFPLAICARDSRWWSAPSPTAARQPVKPMPFLPRRTDLPAMLPVLLNPAGPKRPGRSFFMPRPWAQKKEPCFRMILVFC